LRKGVKGNIPAFTKRTEGSFSGIKGALGITACPFDWKNQDIVDIFLGKIGFS